MNTAWFYLGYIAAQQNRHAEAVGHYRRALEVDPSHTRSYLFLGRALLELDNRAEAVRYWKHGLKAARQPAEIAQALAEIGE